MVTAYLMYALLFKLAVIAAGVVCIVLGYRLFPREILGAGRRTGSEKGVEGRGSDLDVNLQNQTLTLRNAAPGTIFALFGAAVIIVVVWTGSTSLTMTPTESGPATVLRSSYTSRLESILKEYFEEKTVAADEAMREVRAVYNEEVLLHPD